MAVDAATIAKALSPTDTGTTLQVKVVPGASRSRIAGMLGDRLKVQVAAPAEGGRANAALCRLLADVLDVPVSAVSVQAGATQPRKAVSIEGIRPDEVVRRLLG